MLNLKQNSHESKVLSWMRFPLALLIVFIHTGFTDDKSDIGFYIGTFISNVIASIAVPTFFFISGYLFFAKYSEFGFKEYTAAMKKKLWSLVVPYFLWIALVYYGYGFYSGFASGPSPSDLYHIFWAQSDGYIRKSIFGYTFSTLSSPAGLGVLWFIRDLIVVMLLTPLIWWIVKRLNMWAVLVFILPYLIDLAIPLQGFGLVAFCFFSLGATFSICGKRVTDCITPWGGWILTLFSLSLILKFVFAISHIESYHYSKFVILIGLCSLFVLADKAIRSSLRINNWIIILGETSFFLYVCHTLPIFLPLRHITDIICKVPYVGNTTAYFFSWGFRIIVIASVYYALKRTMPSLLSFLIGGRALSKVNTDIKRPPLTH